MASSKNIDLIVKFTQRGVRRDVIGTPALLIGYRTAESATDKLRREDGYTEHQLDGISQYAYSHQATSMRPQVPWLDFMYKTGGFHVPPTS